METAHGLLGPLDRRFPSALSIVFSDGKDRALTRNGRIVAESRNHKSVATMLVEYSWVFRSLLIWRAERSDRSFSVRFVVSAFSEGEAPYSSYFACSLL